VELIRKNTSLNSPIASGIELVRNNTSLNSSVAFRIELIRSNNLLNSFIAFGSLKLSFIASGMESIRELLIII
jgi:hypothetical protein